MKDKKLLNEIEELDDEPIGNLNKKKKFFYQNKLLTIVIIVIIIFIAYSFYMAYTGNFIYKDGNYELSLETNEEYYESYDNIIMQDKVILDEAAEDEQLKLINSNLIVTNTFINMNDNIIVTLKNQNNRVVSNIDFYMIFYDAENKPIKIEEEYIIMIDSNDEHYIKISNLPEVFERFECLAYVDIISDRHISMKDKVSFETSEKDGKLIITGKNNSDKKIENMEFAVIFYNENNHILDVKYVSEFELRKNKKFELDTYLNIYTSESYEEKNYTRYEVKLLDAYAYND